MYEVISFKLRMSQLNPLFLRKTNNSISPMACGDHVAVVAVDIGSAFSGYAYQYRTDYLKNPTENITCPHVDNMSPVDREKRRQEKLHPLSC